MVNCMHWLGWAVVPDQTLFWMFCEGVFRWDEHLNRCAFSKEGCLPLYGWIPSNRLKAWIKHRNIGLASPKSLDLNFRLWTCSLLHHINQFLKISLAHTLSHTHTSHCLCFFGEPWLIDPLNTTSYKTYLETKTMANMRSILNIGNPQNQLFGAY